MSFEEKVQEYIESIKNNKLDDPDLVFSDGTSQHVFYKKLCDDHKKISTIVNPTPEQQIYKYFYHEIKRVLNEERYKKAMLKQEERNRLVLENIENKRKKEREKIKELLEVIDEYKGLPPKKDKDGKVYAFSDGMYYVTYYRNLEKFYLETLDKVALNVDESIKIEGFEKIRKALDIYEVSPIKYQLSELKKDIIEIGNNNKFVSKNDFFEDHEDTLELYKNLKGKYNAAKNKKNKTREQEYIVGHFHEVEVLLKQATCYGTIIKAEKEEIRIKELKEKIEELMKTIRTIGKVPTFTKKDRKNQEEYLFSDGTNQRFFLEDLRRRYRHIEVKKNLSERDIVIKNGVEEIEDLIKQIAEEKKVKKEKAKQEKNDLPIKKHMERTLEREKELIETIEKLGRIPSMHEADLYRFSSDGISQRRYYNRLIFLKNNLSRNKELNWKEMVEVESYERIKKVIDKLKTKPSSYELSKVRATNHHLILEERTNELIETIKKLGELPPHKTKGDENPYTFQDGTLQRSFYVRLATNYNKFIALPKDKLTKNKLKYIECYEKIQRALEKAKVKARTVKGKIQTENEYDKAFRMFTLEFIQTLLKIERLPKIGEFSFEDGQDYRLFYDRIRDLYGKVYNYNDKNKEFTTLMNNYENIEWYIGFIHLKKYYEEHLDLNMGERYISEIDDSIMNLSLWLAEQREYSKKPIKTMSMVEKEKMLDALYPAWYLEEFIPVKTKKKKK